MFKGKFVVLTLVVAAAVMSWQMMPANVNTAQSGIVDACSSSATTGAGPYCWLSDPVGGGESLLDLGATITVIARDNTGAPIPNIPTADVWVTGCADGVVLCGGSSSINADSVTNANGQTTLTNAHRGGGYDTGVNVVIQGTTVADPGNCAQDLCLPITYVSTDVDGDLAADSPDFSLFALGYTSPPKVYSAGLDFNCDGQVELIDFTIFAQHYLLQC
jgi:hypothetical protein